MGRDKHSGGGVDGGGRGERGTDGKGGGDEAAKEGRGGHERTATKRHYMKVNVSTRYVRTANINYQEGA